jgi:hypothetical protein
MTRHLSTPELLDVLEGAPSAGAAHAHLAVCESCAETLRALTDGRALASAAADVPEPSPEFWHLLSARVRDAVRDEPMPGPWWMGYWRPLAAIGATLVVVAAVTLSTSARRGSDVVDAPAPVMADVEVSEMWRLMETAVDTMPLDDAREAGILPTRYATDQAIEALTADQRARLAALIRAEMGVSE